MQSRIMAPAHRRFETLEPRAMLAGDVTATAVDGLLIIEGDMEGNQLRLRSGENPGEIVVAGFPDSGTTINGQTGPQLFPGVRAVATDLGAGDDVIVLDEARVAANVFIRTGVGDDRVVLGRPDASVPPTDGPAVVIGGALSIMTGPGNDVVSAVDLAVADFVAIQTGQGDDVVRLGRPMMDAPADVRPSVLLGGALRVGLGPGEDLMALHHVHVHGSLFAHGGRGNDQFVVNHVAVQRAMELWTGAGEDDVAVQHSSAAAAHLNTGIGDDHAAVVDSTFRSLAVHLGAGDDALSIKDTTVSRIALLNGGRGDDRLVMLGSNLFATARIAGFERPDPNAVA